MAKVKSGQPLRSAERLLQVLTAFTVEQPQRATREIAAELDLAVSTVWRLLQTLEKHGFLRSGDDDHRYSLDERVGRLALVARVGRLVTVAAPHLDALLEKTEETTILTVLDGAETVHADVRKSPHFVAVYNPPGYRMRPYDGFSTGKVLLAWLPDGQLRALVPPRWQPRTRKSIHTLPGFRSNLAKVRERGYATNDAETEDEAWAVAAPVRGRYGAVEAALCCSLPRTRASDSARRRITDAVRRQADQLSKALRTDA